MDHIVTLASKANNSLWAEGDTSLLSQKSVPATEKRELLFKEDYDVAIIGGGFSGLWSAFHLNQLDPTLKIAIFEARTLGFGASGRNGGWASSEYPVSKASLLKRIGATKTGALFAALEDAIGEIQEFSLENENITDHEIGFVKSGSLYFARNEGQSRRLRQKVDENNHWLTAQELAELIRVEGARGGLFNPSCGTIHPFNLIMTLANFLRKRGVAIFEGSWASSVAGGVLVNSSFVRAPMVIQATEVFAEPKREFIPLYSLMVATEPLSKSTWNEIGNSPRFTFAENSHMINYAQRTIDDRIAIGGRGATYPFGSKLAEPKEATRSVHNHLKELLISWFPSLKGVQFTHAWGGAVAITRDWEPYVHWDRDSGFGRLGGYAGDGVTMSYLSAKIIANEVLDQKCELRSLHFVNRKIRNWEPEPIRYLGVNALVKLSAIADYEERLTKRASLLNRIIEPLILR